MFTKKKLVTITLKIEKHGIIIYKLCIEIQLSQYTPNNIFIYN